MVSDVERPTTDPRAPSPDSLLYWYQELGWSTARIADHLGIKRDEAKALLTHHQIPMRVGIEDQASKPWLYEQYVEKGRSTYEIARDLGPFCQAGAVWALLERHGIVDKPHSAEAIRNPLLADCAHLLNEPTEAHEPHTPARARLDKDTVMHLYAVEGRSAAAIGADYGVSAHTIISSLREWGAVIRKRGARSKR